MKKLLLLSACVMLAFSACKKDSTTKVAASNTITATVGGANINFSTTAIAQLASDSGVYVLAVQGVSGTGSSAQSIVVGLVAEGPIVKGTYTLNSSTNLNTVTVIPGIEYAKTLSGNDSDIFGNSINVNVGSDANLSVTGTATVTITSISSTNVQGTFSGMLVNDADGTTTETVSNGKFNVDISANKVQSASRRISAATMQLFKNRIRN